VCRPNALSYSEGIEAREYARRKQYAQTRQDALDKVARPVPQAEERCYMHARFPPLSPFSVVELANAISDPRSTTPPLLYSHASCESDMQRHARAGSWHVAFRPVGNTPDLGEMLFRYPFGVIFENPAPVGDPFRQVPVHGGRV
jgi:hypothetical protein